MTALVGDERFPALSPDGTQVAFEWSGETRENANIWVQQVGAGVPAIPLTTDPATETMPAWSPDGTRIAYQRQKGDRFSLHVVSASGGSSRQFSEWLVTGMMSPASWTPDAASVVTADVANGKPRILVIPVAGGEAREMFSSLAARLFRDPVVAPDESALAFHWCKDTLDVCDVYLLALAPGYVARGTPTPLTHDGHQAAGLVWSRDAQSVIYADGLRRGLMRISRSGASERLELAGIGAFHPSLSKSGDRLAFTRVGWDMHLWRFGRDTSEPEPLLRSTQVDIAPDLSADGSQVVFGSERAGLGRQIWIADADAGHPRALTEPTKRAQGRPRWSPNSKAIVYSSELDDGRRRAMIVDVATGKTRPLQSGFAEEQMPSWSADGGWIIFSTAVNGRLEIWRAPSEGSGPTHQLTKAGGFVGIESPSGQLFYTKGRASPIFMRLPDGGERQVVPSVSQWSFAPTERHLYYIAREEGGSRTVFVLRRLDLATGGTTTLNRFSALDVNGLTVSADGKTIITSAVKTSAGDDLVIIRNFR